LGLGRLPVIQSERLFRASRDIVVIGSEETRTFNIVRTAVTFTWKCLSTSTRIHAGYTEKNTQDRHTNNAEHHPSFPQNPCERYLSQHLRLKFRACKPTPSLLGVEVQAVFVAPKLQARQMATILLPFT
jgi:hypothetical protein